MIKGVVFDLDHTLFDRYATLRVVLPELYKRLRNKIPDNLSEKDFIEAFIEGEKKYFYYGWIYTVERLAEKGIFLPSTSGEEVWYCIYTYCWPMAAVKFPFTEPCLKELKNMGLKLGLLTNGSHAPQQIKIDMLGIEKYFDEIIISGDVGAHKPDPKPFAIMSERLGIAPSELLYVGDNPLNDVEGSRNAGYIPVWVKTVGNWEFENIKRCQYEVETVAEIPNLVKDLLI
ncbi:MAG: HAD family hydrolase [Clostridia bacterium]|nr:HAD family hydrolase [Clostridia bacterium]